MNLKSITAAIGCSAALVAGSGSPVAAVPSQFRSTLPAAASAAPTLGMAPVRKVPTGVTYWYPGPASTFVPGMWALKRKGNRFWFASNTEGMQCLQGTISGTKIKYRYYTRDFDFPASTGTGTGRMKMSGRNLLLRAPQITWGSGYVTAIPGASANKSWVNATQGKKALAECAQVL